MFATTADGLLAFFRAEVDDQTSAESRLWEDWEAYGYMTEGFDALLKKAEVRYEKLTLPFTADVPTVALPAKVLHIRSMRIVGGGEVTPRAMTDLTVPVEDYGLQLSGQSAMFEGSGTPCVYVRDYESRALRLVPIPNASGTLELQCTVNLGAAMQTGVALPTTDSEDLRLVLHYMKSLAYQKHDAETEDLVRARFHEERFRAGVLERESKLRNFRRPPGVVRMQGW